MPAPPPAPFAFLLGLLLCFPGRAQDQTNEKNFFLPQNPVAAAYVLGRLSNQELIDAPRGEFVYSALLQRNGLDLKYRLEALEGLAKIHHTDRTIELLQAIISLDKKGDAALPSLRDLSLILLGSSPAALSSSNPQLRTIIAQSELMFTRQVGYAARIVAERRPEAVWNEAESSPAQLTNLLQAVPLVPETILREPFYLKVKPLLQAATPAPVLEAAASALVSIPNHGPETFSLLSGLVQSGIEPAALIPILARVPVTDWPAANLPSLANATVAYLSNVPPEQRAEARFVAALEFANELAARLPGEPGRALGKVLRRLGPTLVTLHAVYEQMRFDKDFFVAEAGKPVAITLQNEDAMPHNLAILAPGALKEIGQAAEKMTPEPDAQGRLYVPVSPKILHATKLVAPGQKLQLAFTAPTECGEYPYVCTFPGHWLRMSGTMAVVADVDAYLTNHALPRQPQLTEWKLADFSGELAPAAAGRNAAFGKQLFSKLACVQCHRLGSEGYGYGPDLTEVWQRYKGDRAELLQQILEPSQRIDERYRNYTFEVKDGDSVLGMVLQEDDQSVTIQSGPADSLIQVLKKSEIQRRTPQHSSPMPVGLLNSLSKSEILDLLSCLESGGKIPPHEHGHAAAIQKQPTF
jgi:putative heme-binding domain-containing protein